MCSQGALGSKCCLWGRPCPPLSKNYPSLPLRPLLNANTGNAINNCLTVLLPPPSYNTSSGQPLPACHLSTLCLMLASSFFVSPLSTTMCVIVLDLSWWLGDLVWPCWLWTKQIYFMYVWDWAYAYSMIVFLLGFSGFFFYAEKNILVFQSSIVLNTFVSLLGSEHTWSLKSNLTAGCRSARTEAQLPPKLPIRALCKKAISRTGYYAT